MPSEFEPVRIGLIGCGGMGSRHALAVAEMHALGGRAVEIVAICDTDPARRAEIAALIEAACGRRPEEFAEVPALLDCPAVEAVDIVLPTSLHHLTILAALAAGKHVLVEKPLALTVAACTLVVEAAAQSGRVVAVAENFRRIPANRAFGALVRAGAFGPLDVMFVRNFAAPEPPFRPGEAPVCSPDWYRDRSRAGGYHVLEMGVHEADLQGYWFGPVETVTAETRVFPRPGAPRPDASEDMLTAALHFAGGFTSTLAFCSTIRGVEIADRVLVGREAVVTSGAWHAWQEGAILAGDGSRRSAEASVADWLAALPEAERQRLLPRGAWPGRAGPAVATQPLSYGVGLAIHDFARAVRSGTAPEIGPVEARAAVATCCAILESAESGAPVAVAEVLAGRLRAAQAPLDRALGLAD